MKGNTISKGRFISLEERKRRSVASLGINTKFGDGLPQTSLRRRIRDLSQYRLWRTAVFERDNYVCVIGGEDHGNRLNADHIIAFAVLLQMYRIRTIEDAIACSALWNVANGRTLCIPCHRNTETWGCHGQKAVREVITSLSLT